MAAQVKVLLTGGTGYVGGTLLTELFTKPQLLFHSGRKSQSLDITIICLTRTEAIASQLKAAYPPALIQLEPSTKISVSLDTVIGNLEALDVLEKAASEVDVVIHCANADHEDGAKTLLKGISKAPSKAGRPTPNGKPVLLHVSGAGNVYDPAIPLGTLDPVITSDSMDSPTRPLKLSRERMHAALEQDISASADQAGSQLAILSPAFILGQGTGKVGRTETFPNQWYNAVLQHGAVFVVDKGQNVGSASSVEDIADAILWALGEVIQVEEKPDVACRFGWGSEGYYYIESFEILAMDRATELAKRLVAEGKLPSDEVQSMSAEECKSKFGDWVPIIAGVNMRSRADRLKELGWRPKDSDWREMARQGTGERL